MILFISGSRADSVMIESMYRETKWNGIDCDLYNLCLSHERDVLTLTELKPEYIFVCGDRWEIAQICIEAVKLGIKIIHQGGGEVSNGSYDDIFRDCISRMADIHFIIDDRCFNKMFEFARNKKVYTVGSPRTDYLKNAEILLLKNEYGMNQNKKTALVIYHPATAINEDHNELISALKESGLHVVCIGANQDKKSDEVNYDFKKAFLFYYDYLDHCDYVNLISQVDILIGNTSAGISEAPTFKLPFVNVGHRQDGRSKLNNVIDCKCIKESILEAIQKGLKMDRNQIEENRFSDGHASERIAKILKEIL